MAARSLSKDARSVQPAPIRRVPRLPDRPSAHRYPSERNALLAIGTPTKSWSYGPCWSPTITQVLRYDNPEFPNCLKEYHVLTRHKDGWSINDPEPPFELYNIAEVATSQTVYVCEGEKTAEAAAWMGLPAITSMCGPRKAAMSDWSPLEGKDVVILRDFDPLGLRYAEDVAQLVLTAGASSAKIVTLPGLKEGEDLVEWIANHSGDYEDEDLRAEIEAMVQAAPLVERRTTQTEQRLADLRQTELQCLSSIVPEARDWIIDGIIPGGTLTLITGEPAVGKSLFLHEVAARVTRGQHGALNDAQCDPGAVILLSAVDDLAGTICPRLEAAGADLSQIYAIKRLPSSDDEDGDDAEWQFQADRDLRLLEVKIQQLRDEDVVVRLIVIDPVGHYLGRAEKGSAVRNTVSRLADLARRSGAAIVLVSDSAQSETGKSGHRQSHRASDSSAIATVSRSAWLIERDPEDPNRRLLSPLKTNLCRTDPGLGFSIYGGDAAGDSDTTPLTVEFNRRPQKSGPKKKGELSRAILWLQDQLSAGPVHSTTLKENGLENGFTVVTLRRAYHWLGGHAKKEKVTNVWCWSLPEKEPVDEAAS